MFAKNICTGTAMPSFSLRNRLIRSPPARTCTLPGVRMALGRLLKTWDTPHQYAGRRHLPLARARWSYALSQQRLGRTCPRRKRSSAGLEDTLLEGILADRVAIMKLSLLHGTFPAEASGQVVARIAFRSLADPESMRSAEQPSPLTQAIRSLMQPELCIAGCT